MTTDKPTDTANKPPVEMEPECIGDGVYVEVDRDMLKLTTIDGHVIYLQPGVMEGLIAYYERVLAKAFETDK